MTEPAREYALRTLAAFLSRCAGLLGREVTVVRLDYQEFTGRLTSMGLQQDPPAVVAYLAGREPMMIRQVTLIGPPGLPVRRQEAIPVEVLPALPPAAPFTTPEV